MGLRIIAGIISTTGYPPQGVVEFTYNPLQVVSTTRANVTKLQAYGDAGYFATEPFALISFRRLSIEDIVTQSGNVANHIYSPYASFVTNPENQFQRILYHRMTLTWNYVSDDYTQGRISELSFLVVGDAVPLESLPLQPLPLSKIGKVKVMITGRIMKEHLEEIPRALPSRKKPTPRKR